MRPRRRRPPEVSRTAPSRRPVTGGTRVARMAGISAASTARPVPSTSAVMIVRLSTTVPSLGNPISSASNNRPITGAKAMPASRPSTEAKTPIANASTTTEVMIWRRLAPRVRSIANSRVRWATVIEKVLKMRKAATNSATPANTSSAVLRMPMNSPTSSCWLWVFSSPVSTSMDFGSTEEIRFASVSWSTSRSPPRP